MNFLTGPIPIEEAVTVARTVGATSCNDLNCAIQALTGHAWWLDSRGRYLTLEHHNIVAYELEGVNWTVQEVVVRLVEGALVAGSVDGQRVATIENGKFTTWTVSGDGLEANCEGLDLGVVTGLRWVRHGDRNICVVRSDSGCVGYTKKGQVVTYPSMGSVFEPISWQNFGGPSSEGMVACFPRLLSLTGSLTGSQRFCQVFKRGDAYSVDLPQGTTTQVVRLKGVTQLIPFGHYLYYGEGRAVSLPARGDSQTFGGDVS